MLAVYPHPNIPTSADTLNCCLCIFVRGFRRAYIQMGGGGGGGGHNPRPGLIITGGQFNKTVTSVIYKCSYCFQTLNQWLLLLITLLKFLLNRPWNRKNTLKQATAVMIRVCFAFTGFQFSYKMN